MSHCESEWQAEGNLFEHIVIKHTFLAVDDRGSLAGLDHRRRFCSDSILCEGLACEMCCESATTVGSELEAAPCSEDELDDRPLTHSAECCSFDMGSICSGCATPDHAELHCRDQLVADNLRLALENEQLRQRCLQQSADRGDSPKMFTSSPPMQPMQPPTFMWVPYTFAMCGPPQQSPVLALPTVLTATPRAPTRAVVAPPANESEEAAHAGVALESAVPPEERTTALLRNLPCDLAREELLKMLDGEGFSGYYDFVYLPIDFTTQAGLGYALVNLVTPAAADRFRHSFDGSERWAAPGGPPCAVSWSGPHQGLAAHVQRYRNSAVMHPSVPDEIKPMAFAHGVRVPFPEPTERLRAPRIRHKVPKQF